MKMFWTPPATSMQENVNWMKLPTVTEQDEMHEKHEQPCLVQSKLTLCSKDGELHNVWTTMVIFLAEEQVL
jgi:hypothetical protein